MLIKERESKAEDVPELHPVLVSRCRGVLISRCLRLATACLWDSWNPWRTSRRFGRPLHHLGPLACSRVVDRDDVLVQRARLVHCIPDAGVTSFTIRTTYNKAVSWLNTKVKEKRKERGETDHKLTAGLDARTKKLFKKDKLTMY